MGKGKRKGQATSKGQATGRGAGRAAATNKGAIPARRLLEAGVLIACCALPAVMLPGGSNPFGPVKALVLSLGVLCVVLSFALEPRTAAIGFARLRERRSSWALAAFAGLTLLSSAVSLDPAGSLRGTYPEYQGVIAFLAYLMIAFAIASLDAEESLALLARGLTVALLVVGAYALVQTLGADPFTYRFNLNLARARSTLGNASNLGVFCVLALPYAIGLLRAGTERRWRAAAGVAAALGVVALVASLSRGAWLGAVAGAAVWLAIVSPGWEPQRRKRVLLSGAGALVAAALVVALTFPGIASRAASAFDTDTGTALWRRSVWASGLQMASDRPVLGWGPNSFRLAYPSYRRADLAADSSDPQVVADAHNLFVNTLAERGVLAVLALVAWLVLLGREVWKSARAGRGEAPAAPAAATLAALVATQFHFLTLDTGALFFGSAVLVGALAAPAAAGTVPQPGRQLTRREPQAARPIARYVAPAWWAAVGLAGLLVVGSAGALAADRVMGGATALLGRGGSPEQVSERFESAAALAPWDPSFDWAHGHAMVQALERGAADRAAFDRGIRAMESAGKRLPHDTRLLAERADLVLAGGLAFGDGALFDEAYERYDALLQDDPYNGPLWIGRGSASAGLARWNDAVADYEHGVELAARSLTGWSNLAVAYERVGRAQDAARARAQAEALNAAAR